LQFRQKLVENGQFARVYHQVLAGRVGGSRLGAVEEIGVIAALAQLHEDVEQSHAVRLSCGVYDVDVFHQDLGVPGSGSSKLKKKKRSTVCFPV